MLAMRKVEIGRAVWFVRAFGGVEIVSEKSCSIERYLS